MLTSNPADEDDDPRPAAKWALAQSQEDALVELIATSWEIQLEASNNVQQLFTHWEAEYYSEFFNQLGFPDLGHQAQQHPKEVIVSFCEMMENAKPGQLGQVQKDYESANERYLAEIESYACKAR